ncbi:cell division inhibitor SepF [Saccharopolyspora antimicrobica]|uniref:Cell division inhibitor SepF n=1 Tax=Saccharopolyspora antimicrobica TaxID=455193 RepID=A0A1I4ZK39_9PSEU|nr:cell division protein SepF [Saccharopolyspora antimicrobica]SFN50604.1 cell division inhibitor SepF [Saccharopolyspora antimicrobica]
MVKTLHPQSYADVCHVGDYFRQGNSVLMDLSAVPNAEARQLVDFAAGMVVARDGSMERVASKVFLLTHPKEES